LGGKQTGHGSTFYLTLPVSSLAKLCAHIFTALNLQAGSVTLVCRRRGGGRGERPGGCPAGRTKHASPVETFSMSRAQASADSKSSQVRI